MKTLVKTGTPGWFEEVLPDGSVAPIKARKQQFDAVYESVEEARMAQRALTAVAVRDTGRRNGKELASKPDTPVTVADTGKVLQGMTIEVQCQMPGCERTRVIKPQDRFQVKYCVVHQEEHRREIRRQKQRDKTKARKARKEAKADG